MPAIAAAQATNLRSTRFAPPRAPSVAIERTHLVSRIDQSDAQVTLICAPAGFGKSTLMQQLRMRALARGYIAVWLRLTPDDNDIGCFLRSLAAAASLALESSAHDRSTAGHAALSADLVQGLAADLIDRLSSSEAAVVLFLDDAETIDDEKVWSCMQRMLADLDMRHRIVLGSRAAPRVMLGRRR